MGTAWRLLGLAVLGLAPIAGAAGCVDGRARQVDDGGATSEAGGNVDLDAGDESRATLPALLFTSYPTTWGLTGQNPSDYLYSPDVNVQVDGQLTARFEQNASRFAEGGVDPDGGMPDTTWAATFAGKSPVTAYLGMRVRMRAKIKTDNVTVGAWIWFRIDGGTKVLELCNLVGTGDDRRITGTHDFTQVDCVLDIPSDATAFVFGAGLNGSGTAWFGTATFEQVGTDVALSPRAI
jgi:hypothetical protein